MSSIINTLLVGIGILASLATIVTATTPLIQRYIYKQQLDPQTKARQKKFTRIVLVIGLIIISSIFIVASFFQSSAAASSETIRGTLLSSFSDSGNTDISALAWSPDSTRIASIDSVDGTINIWNALTGNDLITYQPPSRTVNSLSWSPDSRYIAVKVDNQLQLLEVDSTILRPIFTFNSCFLSNGHYVIAWSPDGSRIATACSDYAKSVFAIQVWNVSNGKILTYQKPAIDTHHSAEIYALAWSPNQEYIASSSADGTIQVWDINKGDKLESTIKEPWLSDDSNIAWSPNGQSFAAEDSHGTVSVWLYIGDKLASTNAFGPSFQTPPLSLGHPVAWAPDGTSLGFVEFINDSDTGSIQVLIPSIDGFLVDFTINNLSSNDLFQEAFALAWSPNGNFIALAAGYGGIRVWQARGVDNWFLAQVYQEVRGGSWPILQITVLSFGIPLIGLIILGLTLPFKELFRSKPKRTKRKAFFSLLGDVALFTTSSVIALYLASFIIGAYSILTGTIFGLTIGTGLLLCFAPPLLIKLYLLPWFKRRRVQKEAQHYIKEGDLQTKQKKFQNALECYDKALALDPNNAQSYVARGEIYDKQEEYCWAIEEYTKAIALKENVASSYYLRGNAYLVLKQYQQAIEDYNQAVKLAPDDADSYFARGLSYLHLKNLSQARVDFIHASNLGPDRINYAWKAAWARIGKHRDNSQEMAARLEQIALINPQHCIAFVCRGVALGLHNKVTEGLKEVEKGMALDPKNYDALFWKGMLFFYHYKVAIYMEQAKAMVEQSIELGLPPILLFPLFWLKNDRPAIFVQYAEPLLKQYNILN